MVIITPPQSPISRTKTRSPSLSLTNPDGMRDREEEGTQTDGWVKIVDLTKEGVTEKEIERKAKKRSKKEGRSEDVDAEPVKKKCRDQNRSSWVKSTREEKTSSGWRPEINEMIRGCI